MATDWAPTVEDVAALLRARTKGGDSEMDELGTFRDDDSSGLGTRPTATQVEELIEIAVADVRMRVADDMPDEFAESATGCAAMRAANLVELSYFPEQTEADRTVYQSLRLTFEEQVAKLATGVQWWALANQGS